MLKSIIAGLFALVAVTFGLHHSTVATAPMTRSPYADTGVAQVAAAAQTTTKTLATTTPSFQDLSSSGYPSTTGAADNERPQDTTNTSSETKPTSNSIAPVSQQSVALDPLTDYVTQGDLASVTAALDTKFASEIAALANPAVASIPQSVAASGNPFVPYAAASNIGQLSGVTISGATISNSSISGLSATDIPDLSGKYLSLDGGSLSGGLGIGTTTAMAALALTSNGGWANLLTVASTSSALPPFFDISSDGLTTITGKASNPVFVAGTTGTDLQDPRDIAVVGDYLYLVDHNDNAFDVFDISDPASPTQIARMQGPVPGTSLPGPYRLAIEGRYAYVIGYQSSGGTLSVIDISNPYDPVIVGQTQGPIPGTTLNRPEGIVVSGKYAYVANRFRNSITTFDISDPTNPTFLTESVGTIPNAPSNSGPSTLALAGSYLYVGTEGGQLAVFDLSNPANPTYLSETEGNPAFGQINVIKIQGNYAYVADNSQTNPALAIVDISNPSNPTVVSELQTPWTSYPGVQGLWVSGNYVYVTNDVQFTLSVIDVSNPANPTLVNQTPSNQSLLGAAQKMVVSGRYAYILNSLFQSNGGSYGLTIWDLGSAEVTNLEAGTIKTTNLRVEGPTLLDQGANINDDLLVGGDTFINGGVSIYGMASTTVAHGNALSIFGDTLLDNNSSTTPRYLNFGTVTGAPGYGIRDNAGTLEFKNALGAWASIGTGTTTGVAVSYTASLDQNASQVVDANSASATTLYSYTVPAGALGSNKTLRIDISGTYLNNSGSSHAITLALTYGGTTCVSKASGNLGTSATPGGWSAEFLLSATSTTAQDCSFNAGASTGATSLSWGGGGLASVNTAQAQTLTVQATNSAAATTIALTKESASTELLNATGTFGSQWTTFNNSLYYASSSVAIGTSSPSAKLTVWGPDAASSTPAFNVVNGASTTVFSIFDGGNAELSGSLSQSSDQRLKTDVQSLDASSSLFLLEQLNPVSYLRIDQPGTGENLGFLAQQVEGIFPELVSTTSPTTLTPDGTLTLNYTGLVAPIVSAIQDIASISGDFEQNLVGWLGSAGNGIGHLFAAEVDTQTLCVGSTCIDQQQLAAILAAAGQASDAPERGSGSTSDQATSSPDTPPVLQINGDNPATVDVGAVYNDLGADITAPAQDLNLGIDASVDGGATTTPGQITIDTSQAGTHTILYCAADQTGLTGCAARTVIVVTAPASEATSSVATSTAN